MAGATAISAHSIALGVTGTMNTPVENPLRRETVAEVQASATEPVRIAQQQTPSSAGSRRLQWRPLRQPDSAANAVDESQVDAPASLRAVVEKPAKYRLTAAQQPAEEKSVLPTLPAPEAGSAPAPVPAPEKVPPAPARPYIDPQPGATAPPPGQLAPMPLPMGNGEPQKLDEKIAYDCKAAREELNRKKLSDIGLNIEVRARRGFDVPKDCSLADDAFQPRQWDCTDFVWTASGMCHKPLYFEERHLERYGHATGPYTQPVVSGAHFFGSVLMLPWNMGLKLPGECEYALGHYEPGECAPYMIPALPITVRAALFEAGAAAGLVYLLP